MSSLKNLLCSLAFSWSLGCPSVNAKNLQTTAYNYDNISENIPQGNKYALVVVGSSRGERGTSLTDPIDRNSFFLGGVRVYKHLREMGFPRENIFFLYADGRPDFTEPLEAETIAELRQYEFNGSYSNVASQANLETIINQLKDRVTENDTFAMYLGTHGDPEMLEMEVDGFDPLTYSELQQSVNKIRPKQGLLLVDACHSGALVAKLNLPNYVVIASTQSNTYGWVDRDYTTGANFFENLTDPESDENIDGQITMREAFDQTIIEGQQHWNRIKRYLTTRYNWGPFPSTMLSDTSVIPMIYVQRNASDTMVFYRTLSFRR